MAEIDGRRIREMQHGGHCIQVMLSMNDVRNRCQQPEVVDYRDGRLAQLIGDHPEPGAIGHRVMTAPQQREREITHVDLGPGAAIQRVVGDQHPHCSFIPAHPPACPIPSCEGDSQLVEHVRGNE